MILQLVSLFTNLRSKLMNFVSLKIKLWTTLANEFFFLLPLEVTLEEPD